MTRHGRALPTEGAKSSAARSVSICDSLSGSGRKCRAEYAEVLEIVDSAGNPVDQAVSRYDEKFVYEPGVTIRPTKPFDENPFNECAAGIHFWITREEAVAG